MLGDDKLIEVLLRHLPGLRRLSLTSLLLLASLLTECDPSSLATLCLSCPKLHNVHVHVRWLTIETRL